MSTGNATKLEYKLSNSIGAILPEDNLFCRQIAHFFAAYRAGKDTPAPFEQLPRSRHQCATWAGD